MYSVSTRVPSGASHQNAVGRPAGHAAPNHRALEPALTQDLRHLADVSELVGHVPDVERPVAELRAPGEPHLEVADVRLALR